MEKIRQRQQEERSSPLGKLIKSPSEQNEVFFCKVISLPEGGPFSFSAYNIKENFRKLILRVLWIFSSWVGIPSPLVRDEVGSF